MDTGHAPDVTKAGNFRFTKGNHTDRFMTFLLSNFFYVHMQQALDTTTIGTNKVLN